MLKVIVDGKEVYTVENGLINDQSPEWDAIELSDGHFHILMNGKSYDAEVLEIERETKELKIKVGRNTYDVKVKDNMDLLLEKMGLSTINKAKVNELKAPMPGLVIKILVEKGQEVAKGDALVILEAMKMENVLKSPADVTIKSIEAEEGKAIEKNELLIRFE